MDIQQGYKAFCRETHILLDELADATLDGTRKEFMEWLVSLSLLILNDLGMRKLPFTASQTYSFAGTNWNEVPGVYGIMNAQRQMIYIGHTELISMALSRWVGQNLGGTGFGPNLTTPRISVLHVDVGVKCALRSPLTSAAVRCAP